MRKLAFALAVVLLIGGYVYRARRVPNPDPNHTHSDFAVWLDGKQFNFSGNEYMSHLPNDTIEHHPYLHLHDGNGQVIHRHTPGLSLGDFFGSLPIVSYSESTFTSNLGGGYNPYEVRLFVNGKESGSGSAYVFNDGDRLLMTNATDQNEIANELSTLTDDACKYSQTCPGRGAPPTENCVADPAVPCVE